MAGDWIPVGTGIARRREVLAIEEMTGMHRHQVVGTLVDFWAWAGDESRDGHVPSVTKTILGRVIGVTETFWDAVESVGWAAFDDDGLTIPGWETWNGKSAKSRLKANKRQVSRRQRDKSVTRGEKRTEEKRRSFPESISKTPSGDAECNESKIVPGPRPVGRSGSKNSTPDPLEGTPFGGDSWKPGS